MLLKLSRNDLVSVVLPVYNAEKYIELAVQSIVAQTYKNYELIIINDGSTDATQSKLDKFKKKVNVKIVERENRGLVNTLNEAIGLSNGSYIMRMDADDISKEKRMETQVSYLKTNNLDIAGSDVRIFGRLYNHTRKYFTEDMKMKFQLLFTTCFAHPSIFCKKEVLQNNPYDPAFEKIEDYELWTRLGTGSYRMGNCSEVLLNYRVHRKQITTKNRQYQDNIRIQIAQKYGRLYLSTESFVNATDLLLARSFRELDRYEMIQLDNFYGFLIRNFPAYADIINYQFFLCMLHNRFQSAPAFLFKELSFFKRNLLQVFNKRADIKKLPVMAYRSLT